MHSLDSALKNSRATAWLLQQHDLVLLLLFVIPGAIFSAVLDRLLWNDFNISNGEQMLAFYVAPMSAVVHGAVLIGGKNYPLGRVLALAGFNFILSSLPLAHHLFETYSYVPGTDSSLYTRAANYMIQHQTLCSYDNELLGNQLDNHYLYQPGYKYYLAFLLLLTGGELYRLIQFAGAVLVVFSLLSFLDSLKRAVAQPRLFFLLVFAFSGMCPALVKSMLMGLTEWLAVVLMMLGFAALTRKWISAALVFLALAAFVRQTFVPVAVLAALVVLIFSPGKRLLPALCFLLVISLPLLHNFYYAGSLRYFADYSWWASQMGMSPGEYFMFSMVKPYGLVFLQYLGIDMDFFSVSNTVLGFLFIPACWLALFQVVKDIRSRSLIFLAIYLGIMVMLILPSLAYNGTACFPRFQLFNFSAFFILYLVAAPCLATIHARVTKITGS